MSDQKSQKHDGLDSAIDNVGIALNVANELYDKIIGATGENCDACDKTRPSLQSVLETGPDRLIKTTDEIVAALHRIEEVIF